MSMVLIFSEASHKAFLQKETSELCSRPPMRRAPLYLLETHSEHAQNRTCPLLPKLAPPVFPASMADANVDPIAQTEMPSTSHLHRAPCSGDAAIFHPKHLLDQLLSLRSTLKGLWHYVSPGPLQYPTHGFSQTSFPKLL